MHSSPEQLTSEILASMDLAIADARRRADLIVASMETCQTSDLIVTMREVAALVTALTELSAHVQTLRELSSLRN